MTPTNGSELELENNESLNIYCRMPVRSATIKICSKLSCCASCWKNYLLIWHLYNPGWKTCYFPCCWKQIELYQETLQSKTVYGSRLRKNYRCDIFPKKERNYTDERTNGVSSSDMLLTWTRAGSAWLLFSTYNHNGLNWNLNSTLIFMPLRFHEILLQ